VTLALVLYRPVCLRCGGSLRAVVWDQPSLLPHEWLGEPLDYRTTVRICERCGTSRKPDVRAVVVKR